MNRNLVVWLGVGLLVLFLISLAQQTQDPALRGARELAYSDFIAQAKEGRIKEIVVKGNQVTGQFMDSPESFFTLIPYDENIMERVIDYPVKVNVKPIEQQGFFAQLIIALLPAVLIIGVWVMFMRQMHGRGGGGAMGFGKSRARMLTERQGRVTFDDVAGIDEAKDELQEIVEFLKDPQKFQRLGGKIPKGALLVGSPGTGKTLIARAVAGEAGVPFFTISGSDFVEMFVGVGASRVRDMFEQGKKNAPCIIFIDEIDAVGRHRGAGYGGGNDEREQTLNQLLVEMDGFETSEGVIILAATNRPDVLDPALLRPGRFDRQINVPLPDVKGREKILKVHMKKVPLSNNVDAAVIARGTPGFSGAELANIVNEAALMAARKNRRVVTMEDFESAKDKVMMGAERRSMAMSQEEKKLTAYHEAGHALVTLHEPESDPIHKATIVPRGRALGMVMRLPEGDRYSYSIAKMKANLSVGMGGRVAEEIIFGKDHVTSGASGDIKQVTRLARAMVTEWGFSESVGMIDYGDDEADYRQKRISSQTTKEIEKEVQRLINEGYEKAKQVITENIDDLHTIAKALLEYELLSGDEIKGLLRGEAIIRDEPTDSLPPPTRPSVPTSGGVAGGKPQEA
ncbi:MAG: ATP-dependent zinc metalloprotease FtsH [Alphaproteobacteria bacterium]|nr:ATP-dependent zinc metalloprotease FtsH [Alphaproteobacteria bacterium]QQS57008.1 MAG: ATP-dependent zinc metalloprotease FtsH [Alphaproteobacteria bacterium]